MENNVIQSLDLADLYHTDAEISQQTMMAATTSDPSSTSWDWTSLHCPCAASCSHHRERETTMTYRMSKGGFPLEIMNQLKRSGFVHERQSGLEAAMLYTECGPPYEDSMVPAELCLGHSRPPEDCAPFVDVGSQHITSRGKESFSNGSTDTPRDLWGANRPSQGPETSQRQEHSTSLQRPPAQFEGYSSIPSGPASDLFDKRSVTPPQNFPSPDVCLGEVPGPLTSPLYPERDLSVDLLSSEARPIGPIRVTPISGSKLLVGAPTEQCPSHAYPPRPGTGYVPLRCHGGAMTDAVTAPAHAGITSPCLDAQVMPTARSSSLYSSLDDSYVSFYPSRPPTNAPPQVDSTRSRRCTSTPTLLAEGLDELTNKECVYDSHMNLVEPRKRRPFSPSEKEKTRTIRAKGACEICRKSKRRVTMLLSMLHCRANLGRVPYLVFD